VHKQIIFLGMLLTLGMASEDFITDFEYGQMLYRDPRGASCAACHGETGSGALIGEYTDKRGRIVRLNGPDIRNASLQKIRESVHKNAGVMPRYFLTEEEIQTIHAYLQQVNRHKTIRIAALFDRSIDDNQTERSTHDHNQSSILHAPSESSPTPEANTTEPIKSAE